MTPPRSSRRGSFRYRCRCRPTKHWGGWRRFGTMSPSTMLAVVAIGIFLSTLTDSTRRGSRQYGRRRRRLAGAHRGAELGVAQAVPAGLGTGTSGATSSPAVTAAGHVEGRRLPRSCSHFIFSADRTLALPAQGHPLLIHDDLGELRDLTAALAAVGRRVRVRARAGPRAGDGQGRRPSKGDEVFGVDATCRGHAARGHGDGRGIPLVWLALCSKASKNPLRSVTAKGLGVSSR